MTFLPNVGAHDIDPGSHLRYLPPPTQHSPPPLPPSSSHPPVCWYAGSGLIIRHQTADILPACVMGPGSRCLSLPPSPLPPSWNRCSGGSPPPHTLDLRSPEWIQVFCLPRPAIFPPSYSLITYQMSKEQRKKKL